MSANAQNSPVTAQISGEQIMRHLKFLVNIGEHRRSGTTEGDKAFDYVVKQLKLAGLAPQIESYPFRFFDVKRSDLIFANRSIKNFPLYYSGQTAPAGLEREAVFVGIGAVADFAKTDVRNKVAVTELKNGPGNKPGNLSAAYKNAADNGASALVIYIDDWLDNSLLTFNSEEYRADMKMPAVFITRRDGRAMRDAIEKGKTNIKMTLDAKIRNIELKNVFAVIKGQSDETVIINAPYNSWFKSAVERVGTAGAIHLAQTYASIPIGQQPKTLIFSFTSGHEHGFLGVRDFLMRHQNDFLPKTKLFMNLGAGLSGKQYVVEAGKLVDTGKIEDRAAVCSNTVEVTQAAEKALDSEQIKYQILTNLRIGEAREANHFGIPNFALFSLNSYFHTPSDTIEKTTPENAEQAVRVYARILHFISAKP